MKLAATIARFRSLQEELFTDEATVTRGGVGPPVLDPDTGVLTPSAGSTVYSGRCLIRSAAAGGDMVIGGTEVRLRQVTGKFPPDTPVKVDDIVTVTSSTHDASLDGVSFRVTDVIRDGWQVARVCILEEETREP